MKEGDGGWEKTALLGNNAVAIVNDMKGSMEKHNEDIDRGRTYEKLLRRAYWPVIEFYLMAPSKSMASRMRRYFETTKDKTIKDKRIIVGFQIAERSKASSRASGMWHGLCDDNGLDKKEFKLKFKKNDGVTTINARHVVRPTRPETAAEWDEAGGWTALADAWDRRIPKCTSRTA